MTMTISGDGSITGLAAGGLPDATIIQSDLAAGVAGTGPAFSAYPSAGSQSVSNSTFTKVTLDAEIFDTNNNFANSTFTPTVAGYYQINAVIGFGTSAITNAIVQLYKNGSAIKRGAQIAGASLGETHLSVSATVYMNGTTDYLELYGYIQGTTPLFYGGSVNTYFEGSLVRAA